MTNPIAKRKQSSLLQKIVPKCSLNISQVRPEDKSLFKYRREHELVISIIHNVHANKHGTTFFLSTQI